jgi:STE24 endopeptidase
MGRHATAAAPVHPGGAAAGMRAHPWRVALVGALAVGAWLLCAMLLWRSSVPAGLHLPRVDPRQLFSASFLRRSSSFERFLDLDALLASVAVVVVLAFYARRGHVLARESAAGRIGTGLLLAMLAFALAWLAELPFVLAAVWWERRHGISHQGYASALLEGFLALGSRFVFISAALAIAMALARVSRNWWWLAGAPFFAALTLLFSFVSPYLLGGTHPLRDPALVADARTLATREHVAGTPVVVQTVPRELTSPNAEAVGFGPSRRVVLWDTLLDGRFSRREVDVVVAHELGHIAHGHILRRVGWYLLFLLPVTALVAFFTRRRGGLYRPEAVPVGVLVFVVAQLLLTPLTTLVSRRMETEADWSALQATHDPASARALFRGLATSSLADPDPPSWAYVLYADHPTIAQRIALTEAWAARAER